MDEELLQLLSSENVALASQAVEQAVEPEFTTGDFATGLVRSVAAGPTLGLSQQLEAGVRAPFTDLTYAEELANLRQQQRAFEQEYPVTALGGELAGILAAAPVSAAGTVIRGGASAARAASSIPAIRTLLAGERVAQALKPAKAAVETVGSLPILRSGLKAATTQTGQAALEGAIRTEGDLVEKAKAAGIAGASAKGLGIIGRGIGRGLQLGKESTNLILESYGITSPKLKTIAKKLKAKGVKPTELEDIPLAGTIRKLEDAGYVGVKNSDATNLNNILFYQSEITDELGKIITKADEVLEPSAVFQRTNTDRFIKGLTGTDRLKYQKAIEKERKAIIKQLTTEPDFAGGTIADLQRAKVGLNNSWNRVTENIDSNAMKRVMRQDLREEIENRIAQAGRAGALEADAADSLINLNKAYGEAADLKDIFADRIGAKDPSFIEKTFKGLQTTQGAGQLIIAGGGSLAEPATGLAALLTALRTPGAKRAVASALDDPAFKKIAPPIGEFIEEAPLERIGGAMAGQAIRAEKGQAEQERRERLAESMTAINMAQQQAVEPLRQDMAEIIQLLKEQGVSVAQPTPAAESEEPRAQMRPTALRKGASKEEKIARFTQEDPIIQSIIYQESAGRDQAVSRKDAVGLMQLMEGTAKDMGVSDRTDPEQNIEGGKKYYKFLLERYDNDPELALAAYNWGLGNVDKALKKLKAKGRAGTWDNMLKYTSLEQETIDYVEPVIKRSKQIAKNPQKWWKSKLRG
jgi:hypothetical protein